jgi:hypothetical protein
MNYSQIIRESYYYGHEALIQSQKLSPQLSLPSTQNPSAFYSSGNRPSESRPYVSRCLKPRRGAPHQSIINSYSAGTQPIYPSRPSLHPTQAVLLPRPPFRPISPSSQNTFGPPEISQIYLKKGHATRDCWHRFDFRVGHPHSHKLLLFILPPQHQPVNCT